MIKRRSPRFFDGFFRLLTVCRSLYDRTRIINGSASAVLGYQSPSRSFSCNIWFLQQVAHHRTRKQPARATITEKSGEAASSKPKNSLQPKRVTRSMTGDLPEQSEALAPTLTEGPMCTGKHSKTTGNQQGQKRERIQKGPTTTGSLWDPTPRRHLNLEDLDLDKSYVGMIPPPARKEMPPRQPRWEHTGDEPLTDPKKLPKGWNTRGPDLEAE